MEYDLFLFWHLGLGLGLGFRREKKYMMVLVNILRRNFFWVCCGMIFVIYVFLNLMASMFGKFLYKI